MEASWWILVVVAAIATLVAAIALDLPSNSRTMVLEAATWQKWVFVIWTITGPLWLLWDWDQQLPNLGPDKI
jgi:hypothetical protein